MCDDLSLAQPKIPVLDARRDRDVLDSVPLGPFQRSVRSRIFESTRANFFDIGIWNQNCGGEALDQIEPIDAGEQDDR